jgi:stage III sporulation protein AD
MDITRLAVVGIIGALLALSLKSVRPEIAILISLATGIVILADISTSLVMIFKTLGNVAEANGINGQYFKIATKACIIAYITQFSSQLCKDAGEGAIGVKIEFAGKISIVVMALPVVSGFLEAISDLLGRI